MAVGDVVIDAFIMSGSSNVYVQPAAGVEWLVTTIAYSAPTANNFYLQYRKDPSINARLYHNTDPTGNEVNRPLNVKIWVTNTVYLRFYNSAAGNQEAGYSGIQIK